MRLRRSFALSSSVLFTVTSLPLPLNSTHAALSGRIARHSDNISDAHQANTMLKTSPRTEQSTSRDSVVDFRTLWERRRLNEVHFALFKGNVRPLRQPRPTPSRQTIARVDAIGKRGVLHALTVIRASTIVPTIGNTIAKFALGLVGHPYVWGGQTPDGFDCSGLTQYVFREAGIVIPRTSFDQFATGLSITESDLQPGDLLFFQTYAEGASHVAVYIGNGLMVQAQNEETGVVVTSIYEEYYREHFIGAKRLWFNN